MSETIPINFRINEEEFEALKDTAMLHKRTATDIIREFLRNLPLYKVESPLKRAFEKCTSLKPVVFPVESKTVKLYDGVLTTDQKVELRLRLWAAMYNNLSNFAGCKGPELDAAIAEFISYL